MKRTLLRNKTVILLVFLFGYSNLYAGPGVATSMCIQAQRREKEISFWNKQELCLPYSYESTTSSIKEYSYLSFKVPILQKDYFDYPSDVYLSRRDKSLPILIEFDSEFLNPHKEDLQSYQASSRIKERLIQTNPMIRKTNCLYFASGSEYRIRVPAKTGDLRVILYYDYAHDKVDYRKFNKEPFFFYLSERYYQHRSLFVSGHTFKAGKEYELKIEVNPDEKISNIDRKILWTLNGFNISIHELPPNTQFAFDGKDDVGKSLEDVKKEFILYDDGLNYVDYRVSEDCYYKNLFDWWNNRCTEGKR